MIPKSTVKLAPGAYCLIERPDGRAVAFAFLGSVPGMRSYFYGALLAPSLPDVTSPLPERLHINSQAMVHIKCFAENNTPIVGNASKQIGDPELQSALQACTDCSVGTVHSVWGYRAILKKAAEIKA